MGAISDGSSKIYTRDESGKTVDIARENRIRGNAQHSWGAVLAQGVPSLFMCVGARIGGSSNNDTETDIENASQSDIARIEELKTELNGYLTALNIKSADQINEAVSTAQDNYAPKKLAVDNAQAALDKYKADYENLPAEQRPENYDSEVQSLEGELKQVQEAEKAAKAELDKVIENANKAYECAQKLAELRQHVISDPYITESKETLHSFNEARTEFMSATTDDAKRAAAKKLYELAEKEPNNQTMKTVISLLEESYKLKDYKETPAS